MSTPQMYPKITIAGDLGSGKSTIAKILKEKTGFPFFSTGAIQRQIAAKYNMTTLELNQYAETHPEIDDEIDNFTQSLNTKKESFILDSRMAWYFVSSSFKIYLTVDSEVAAKRILSDNDRKSELYADMETAKINIEKRKQSENKRFHSLYGVNCADEANYDIVVDTSNDPPDTIAAKIMTAYNTWLDTAK